MQPMKPENLVLENQGGVLLARLNRPDAGNALNNALYTFPKPLIVAVTGFCMAGGFDLALAVDMIIADESVLPEIEEYYKSLGNGQ